MKISVTSKEKLVLQPKANKTYDGFWSHQRRKGQGNAMSLASGVLDFGERGDSARQLIEMFSQKKAVITVNLLLTSHSTRYTTSSQHAHC